jgi:hypothetical protein
MKILERLPISESGWRVLTPEGAEEVKPFQIVVMLSVTAADVAVLPQDAPRIPAVLDTGHNHNFAIRHSQWERWVQLALPLRGQVQIGGSVIPLIAANLWIHPNRDGTVEPGAGSPFLLKLREGIAVYPPLLANPARLPALGLRAIIRNGLRLTIDGASRELTMESTSP